jgi:hypothetical protein
MEDQEDNRRIIRDMLAGTDCRSRRRMSAGGIPWQFRVLAGAFSAPRCPPP